VVVFQRRSRWIAAALYLVMALVGLSGVVAASTPLGRVAGALLAVAAAFLAVRQARLAVILTADEVIVRNAFRTHRLPWPEIAGVRRPGRYGFGLARKAGGLAFSLRNGQQVCADAYVKAAWDGEIGGELVSAVESQLAAPTHPLSD
jgi:hypothetical protein